MAKNKEYNGAVVEAEFEKLPLKQQLEVYNQLGEYLHEKVVKYQESLGEELNHFEAAKTKLSNGVKKV